jgi:hypothetical protein
MITSDENINLTYTILEDMYEPNRTETPAKTFVQFRLSPFEYSTMEKIARFLNSKGLIPKPTVSSLARVCLFSHMNTVAIALEQEKQKQERLKQQSQPVTFSTPFMSRMWPWSST